MPLQHGWCSVHYIGLTWLKTKVNMEEILKLETKVYSCMAACGVAVLVVDMLLIFGVL